jgi:predicted ABC-type ATPase
VTDKKLTVVGGPNGAGKTTVIRGILKRTPQPYLSADLIAFERSQQNLSADPVAAGREFLTLVDTYLAGDLSFVVESTLSGRTFRRKLEQARVAGFEIFIGFVFLDSSNLSASRVGERVRKGGHDVPEEDIHRRFPRSLFNFWTIYRPLADRWVLVYNGEGGFLDVAVGFSDSVSIRDETVFRQFFRLAGLDYDSDFQGAPANL